MGKLLHELSLFQEFPHHFRVSGGEGFHCYRNLALVASNSLHIHNYDIRQLKLSGFSIVCVIPPQGVGTSPKLKVKGQSLGVVTVWYMQIHLLNISQMLTELLKPKYRGGVVRKLPNPLEALSSSTCQHESGYSDRLETLLHKALISYTKVLQASR